MYANTPKLGDLGYAARIHLKKSARRLISGAFSGSFRFTLVNTLLGYLDLFLETLHFIVVLSTLTKIVAQHPLFHYLCSVSIPFKISMFPSTIIL